MWPTLRQLPQQLHPVGVGVAHHHLQPGAGWHQPGQRFQVGLREGVAGGVHQQGGVVTAWQKQEAVGGGATLQSVLHLEAQALGAEAPQAHQSRFDRELDYPTVVGDGRGRAHQ